MESLKEMLGLSPEFKRGFDLIEKAMSGDIALAASPVTVGASATTSTWTRDVVITLKTAAGTMHNWYNKAVTSGISIADTASATTATATVATTTLTFVDGRASVTITGSTGTWAAADTDTLTVNQLTVLGYTLATVTSVETFA